MSEPVKFERHVYLKLKSLEEARETFLGRFDESPGVAGDFRTLMRASKAPLTSPDRKGGDKNKSSIRWATLLDAGVNIDLSRHHAIIRNTVVELLVLFQGAR